MTNDNLYSTWSNTPTRLLVETVDVGDLAIGDSFLYPHIDGATNVCTELICVISSITWTPSGYIRVGGVDETDHPVDIGYQPGHCVSRVVTDQAGMPVFLTDAEDEATSASNDEAAEDLALLLTPAREYDGFMHVSSGDTFPVCDVGNCDYPPQWFVERHTRGDGPTTDHFVVCTRHLGVVVSDLETNAFDGVRVIDIDIANGVVS